MFNPKEMLEAQIVKVRYLLSLKQRNPRTYTRDDEYSRAELKRNLIELRKDCVRVIKELDKEN